MSVSVRSYESIVRLAMQFYDKSTPLYFSEEHVSILCDMLMTVLQVPSIQLVKTSVLMTEPVVRFKNAVFVSLPLVALLINANVEMPSNSVDYVHNVDLFEGISFDTDPLDSASIFSNEQYRHKHVAKVCDGFGGTGSELTNNHLSVPERIRITHLIRLAFACSHFYRHCVDKTPFIEDNGRPFNPRLELANSKLKKSGTVEDTKIDYSRICNF